MIEIDDGSALQKCMHCLRWENVCLTAGLSDESKQIKILDHVYGESPQGQILAIMGPSGAGKTSLLNILSGRMTKATSNVAVEATVTWGGKPIDVSNLQIRQSMAFVAQDDSLPITATPREAILFSARLRLPKSTTITELKDLTENMLDQLHLKDCADTYVGGTLLKGISGGERKRTSVGVELVTHPKLIFLDEATSGLDSFNAIELVHVLRKVVAIGSTVVLTIHQPGSDIWKLLDRVLLLKAGRVMFIGEQTSIPDVFASCGYPLPPNYNPADWIMNVAQSVPMKLLEDAGFFPSEQQCTSEYNLTAREESNQSELSELAASATRSDRIGLVCQTRLQLDREFKNIRRNKHATAARAIMTISISLLCGCIYYKAADGEYQDYVQIQSAFGALLLALLAMMFSTALPSLLAFPEERPVFLREYSTGHYTVLSYFVSRLVVEILVTGVQVVISTMITYLMVGFQQDYGTFVAVTYVMALTSTALGVMLGSAVADPSVAMELLPALFMPQILFSGFFVPSDLIPNWLAWLVWVFPLSYAVKIVLIYEFHGSCDGLVPNTCQQLLDNADANEDDLWWYWLVLLSQFTFFRLVALFVLRRKAEKFY